MHAREFAESINRGSVKFGLLKKEDLVIKLRELADRLERDERPRLVLQEAYSMDHAKSDDYLFTTLVLEFAELAPEAKTGAKLHGNGERFPVEVAS